MSAHIYMIAVPQFMTTLLSGQSQWSRIYMQDIFLLNGVHGCLPLIAHPQCTEQPHMVCPLGAGPREGRGRGGGGGGREGGGGYVRLMGG